MFDPRKTALPTLVLTAMSAVEGFTEMAPCDQLEVALKSSETGTTGAPVLELPVPITSRLFPPPDAAFHCETWGSTS